MEQGTEQWLEWRRQGIGGSEIAAIFGVCPYNTAYGVWAEKVGLRDGFKGNFATEAGKELEGRARARYELINLEDMPPALAIHPEHSQLRVSLDGIRSDNNLVLEIKCPGRPAHEMALKGEIPEHYKYQCQYQLAVTGADLGHYFSYHDGDRSSALCIVNPDLEFQGRIVAEVLRFWNEYVLTMISPPLSYRDDKLVESDEMKSYAKMLSEVAGATKKVEKNLAVEVKKKMIELGGHVRVRCGNVLVTKTGNIYRATFAKQKTI